MMMLLESELVWRTVFQTRFEAERAIARYIDGFYNPVRRHPALDFISPIQFLPIGVRKGPPRPCGRI